VPAITDPRDIVAELQRRLDERPAAQPGMMRPHLPRVHCADGFNVSVQASRYNYCEPRDDTGPWWSVELGFPSAPMPELADRADCAAEDAATETQTVWGYVPLRRVADVLVAHGGLIPVAETV